MAARPRIRIRVNWPSGLHEPRPGYYTWRDPRNGKTIVLGRMPLAQAIYEVQEANAKVASGIDYAKLADRIDRPRETMSDLIDRMPTEGLRQSTIRTRTFLDKTIREALGKIECSALTTKDVVGLLEAWQQKGKQRTAQSLRNRLSAICRRGCALGWMTTNPVMVTDRVKAATKRRRMTLDEFNRIFEKAPEVAPWLQNAMLLALVSGQDRSTIARWERSFSREGFAIVQRLKTGVKVEIPLALRLDAIGMSLDDVIARCKSTGVVSKYLIHHVKSNGAVKRGSHVKLGTVTTSFKAARDKAGITGEGAPTFHEIRSLAKRLYDAQGNVDTKALLGHMTDQMADMYANSRGMEALKVKIK